MIPVQNIYYMLAYAFQVLNEQGYKDLATEKFNNVGELCAKIIANGVKIQLKRGLNKEYVANKEALSSLRGRINITDSIKNQTILKRQMVCTFDDFSVNTYLNQILKTTIKLLLIYDISKIIKNEIRKLLVYFEGIDTLDVSTINWKIDFNRNNQNYSMLISICYLVVKGLLQTNSEGSTKLMDFIDEQRMSRLYEKFILEYYRKKFKSIIEVNASQIQWQLDDESNLFLPIMKSDITLSKNDKVLIIDAKYYSNIIQSRYDSQTLHSGNLYQIFTYVKNKEVELKDVPHNVSGMLLYAKTDEVLSPDVSYSMSGNKIIVKTLDLNCDFERITQQLDAIVDEHILMNS